MFSENLCPFHGTPSQRRAMKSLSPLLHERLCIPLAFLVSDFNFICANLFARHVYMIHHIQTLRVVVFVLLFVFFSTIGRIRRKMRSSCFLLVVSIMIVLAVVHDSTAQQHSQTHDDGRLHRKAADETDDSIPSAMNGRFAQTADLVAQHVFPVVFLNHGGGPLPVLGDDDHKPLVAAWRKVMAPILGYGKPRAIAVISAHYETHQPRVGGSAHPRMLYDYGGFPPESYKLQYPAPGSSLLARRMVQQMAAAGLTAAVDESRAFDHGVFVPLMMMFPDADIPVIPISVLRSQNAAEHIAMGRALSQFRKEGVLFIGSGSSMHNFKYFWGPGAHGIEFNNALTKVLSDATLTAEERIEQMKSVRTFPGVAEAQPEGGFEHLMPLLTCVGISEGSLGREASNVQLMGANLRDYVFE
ncbi:aromatic ring-opening dioxygenase, LigB subunit, putative [Bodo saltans]|uniref:Aromatic ring-opening dioxygenase, LigB subunit, putative n=1 Tax=Bodo saltans TaxID=75058 RepID=A0A0S4JFW6_BODSA|nr:aromatic ring-opening dioxygenase, LigB subunit, putative [Bodo saltans]|eukprot:CUG88853.1 aromatic ring-opening dioxygenase, LigB subunit, putative [Bodo saltans]